MRGCAVLALTLFVLAAARAGGETPTLESIRSAMDSAWNDVESLTGDITMEFVMPFAEEPLDLTGTGKMYFLRDGGKNKYRKTMTARLPEPFAMEMKLDVLYDGKTVYTTTELMGQAQKQQGEPSLRQGALPPGGTELLDAMEAELDLKVLPDATVGEHEVYVLEGRAPDTGQPAPYAKVRFYIDKTLAIQRKLEIYQADGTVGISEQIENIDVDTKPDAGLFVPR